MMKTGNYVGKKWILASLSTLVCAGLIGVNAITAAADTTVEDVPQTLNASQQINASPFTDQQLDELITKLNRLPESIKNSNPRNIPNFAVKLNNYLATGYFTDTPFNEPLGTNWPQCAFQVGLFIAQYGLPIFKAVGILMKARELWGGIQGISKAIKIGSAAALLGPEGAKVVESLLGIQGVINACFNA